MKYRREIPSSFGVSKFMMQSQLECFRSFKNSEEWLIQNNKTRKGNGKGRYRSDAEFVGWQELPSGEALALYNITVAKHPLYQSTVTAKTLSEYNLKIPPTPFKQKQTNKIGYQ